VTQITYVTTHVSCNIFGMSTSEKDPTLAVSFLATVPAAGQAARA